MLNHQTHGRGPALLLLHGFGISFHIWDELRPHLADRFTCIEVELPGIGLSPLPLRPSSYLAEAVDALDSLRASLGLESWHVVGYSTGSRVAEAYLQTHTSRVDRAAFLCPAQTHAPGALGLQFADRFDARFPAIGSWILSGWRMRFLIQLLGFNLRSNPLVPAWHAEITSQPVDVLKATLRSLPGHGATPFTVPAEAPTLFVWGREDLITATPKRPSSRDMVIHANHSMPQTEPEQTARILLSFLE